MKDKKNLAYFGQIINKEGNSIDYER